MAGLLAMSRGLSIPTRRKCFISYYGGDRLAVKKFIEDFKDVFIDKSIGVSDNDDFINSTNSDYVMSKIREKYLGDSTVTICLIGSCTHNRRYIDWELKASLRQGTYTPNGLLGIILPYQGNEAHLPKRFNENWHSSDRGYAKYMVYPKYKSDLRGWIEDVHQRRISRPELIRNSQEMMKYSKKCLVHGITHGAT